MTSYVAPKKNSAFIMYAGLFSQSAPATLVASPTLAAGDFKVSIDGGATANLATLPTNTPAGSGQIKISLSAAEMNGDNITITGQDAAGAEWASVVINIQTAAQTLDEMDTVIDAILVDTAEIGAAGAGLTNINLPNQTMDIVGNITGNLSGSVGSVTAGVTLAASAVQAIWDALTSALTTVGSVGKLLVDNINATVSSRASQTSADAIETDTQDIQTRLPAALVSGRIDASVGAMAANVMTAAAAAADLTTELQSGLATSAALATAQTSIDDLPTNAELATALGTADDATLAAIAALNNLSAAQVNAEVVDALATDTYAEPGQGAPAATASLAAKINYLFKAWRNKKTVTATTFSLFADDASTVDQKSTVSDAAGTFTEGEKASGP